MAVSSLKCRFTLIGMSRCTYLLPRLNLMLHPVVLRTSSSSFLGRKRSSKSFLSSQLDTRFPKIPNYYTLKDKEPILFDVYTGSKLSRHYSTGGLEPEKKPTLIQRFKQMYRDYWYVLVPVHAVTSLVWFGGFYYLLQSGVDVIAILERIEVSETLLKPLRDSKAGYLAISYALYKIATPLRYTVTLGGTTISINYLTKWGHISPKPIPTRDKLKEMYQERKDNLKERRDNIIESVRETKAEFKERKDNIIESVRETKAEFKERKDNIIESVRETAGELKPKTNQVKDRPESALSRGDKTAVK